MLEAQESIENLVGSCPVPQSRYDRVLLGQAENGGYVELKLEVPRSGRYALGAYLLTGPEGGLLEVSLDGQVIGRRFDSFGEAVARSGRVDFGTLLLCEGRHRLRFTAVGKDPRSKGYHFGIDCLELRFLGKP